MKKIALVLVVLCLCIATAFAHPGDTDANGGHYDYETGTYHYHHGYEAHYHTDGRCPYNYDNRTGWNSGNPGNDNTWDYTSAPRPTTNYTQQNSAKSGKTNGGRFFILVVALSVFCFFACILVKAHQRDKEERRRIEEQTRIKLEKERLEKEEERRKEIEFYSSHDLETIAGVPEMYMVGPDGLPAEREKGDGEVYGRTLEVYINGGGSSYSYHRKECRYAKRMVNILDPSYDFCARNACGVCRPIKPPETNWFKKYLEEEKKCTELGIKPKHRAQ